MKKKVITYILVAFVAIIISAVLALRFSASFQREIKDWQSDVSGGLNRTVKVYSNDGTEIGSWHGKIDVDVNEGGRIKFDLDGKRTIVIGGTVIIQEE